MTDLSNRFCGVTLGVHVGDALGAPYETWTPKQIAADLKERGGLQFFPYLNPWRKHDEVPLLPAGRPTDDSDQTAALAHSLLESNGVDSSNLRSWLRESVVNNRSLLWEGKALGAGGTTRATLSDDPQLVAKGFANKIGTNGSLMRCSPMALWYYHQLFGETADVNSRHEACLAIQKMSKVTHQHPHSIEACIIYSSALAWILHNYPPDEAISAYAYVVDHDQLNASHLYHRIRHSLADTHLAPYDPGAFPMRGTAELSLYVAFYVLQHAKTFEAGIETAIRVGGDTDTYAAIAGGLLGAKFGSASIPPQWRRAILGHDAMVNLATQIYQRRT